MKIKAKIKAAWRRAVDASKRALDRIRGSGGANDVPNTDLWNARSPEQVFRQEQGIAMYWLPGAEPDVLAMNRD
ncbi:uncharacterized protein ARMOST_10532 [Armillaria ostoyae]|uniref:Uncharacterized protein n=1 Tax=Armillaria ostoyae TaxID=47428 RepID=A0A284REK9_ARMOS|nr:uncharacterized protein ARMOST_10532 [Armillaria ostoyae]